MKKLVRKLKRFISIFHFRSINRILVKLYSMGQESNLLGRTDELIKVIYEKDFQSYLEVGVWKGENFIPIAKQFPNLMCHGVDPYSGSSFGEYYKGEIMALVDGEHYEKLFQEISIKVKKLNNINIIRKTSEEAAKEFADGSMDIVFIDARHDYDSVVKDIRLWLPKVKMGGVLCGHDYSVNFFGVIEAVNFLLGYDNVAIKADSTWFYQKRT